MPKIDRNEEWIKGVSERLRLFVDSSGYKSGDIADRIGAKQARFSNYLTQGRLIEITLAVGLKREFGVPLDWLYMGDKSSLPASLYERLYPKTQ